MRDASTYRGARKRQARAQGQNWSATPFRKTDIKLPAQGQKGKALPLKHAGAGQELEPSTSQPGRFRFKGEHE